MIDRFNLRKINTLEIIVYLQYASICPLQSRDLRKTNILKLSLSSPSDNSQQNCYPNKIQKATKCNCSILQNLHDNPKQCLIGRCIVNYLCTQVEQASIPLYKVLPQQQIFSCKLQLRLPFSKGMYTPFLVFEFFFHTIRMFMPL